MAIFTSGMGVGLGGGDTVINIIGEAALNMEKKDNILILDNNSDDLILEKVGRYIELESETVTITFEKEED